jgi:polyhydroxyalkanoate synthesis regulator phasin
MTLDGWDKPKLELDRIDVNKGYEPDNLRFVTRSENQRNRRSMQAMQKLVDELRAEVAELKEKK